MDEDTVTVYICGECGDQWENWTVTFNGTATVRTCACGRGQHVTMEGPSLDLGIIRDRA